MSCLQNAETRKLSIQGTQRTNTEGVIAAREFSRSSFIFACNYNLCYGTILIRFCFGQGSNRRTVFGWRLTSG